MQSISDKLIGFAPLASAFWIASVKPEAVLLVK
jgi:hypothetical protein